MIDDFDSSEWHRMVQTNLRELAPGLVEVTLPRLNVFEMVLVEYDR